MRKVMMIAAMVLMGTVAHAQEVGAAPSVPSSGTVSVPAAESTYLDTLRSCGTEWKARADKATNKGMEAWQAFRAKCVLDKGYTTKRGKKKGGKATDQG